MRNVLLIRHGATALNSDDHTVDRIRGWSDWELSTQGMDEALGLAEAVFAYPVEVLYTSDLRRARQTAHVISRLRDIPLAVPTKDFRPWDVGIFVGAQAARAIPQLVKYSSKWPHKMVPGGESFNTFRTRFVGGLLSVLDRHDGLIGIVTHHRCERLLKAWIKGGCNGEIDHEEFGKKGETTGHCEIIEIPTLVRGRAGGELAGVGT